MFDEFHNMSMCSNDIVLRWLYLYICVETVDMYLSVVGDSSSVMSNDYELTMDYDVIVSLSKGLFQIYRYYCFDIWNMWLTCVSSCRKHAWY